MHARIVDVRLFVRKTLSVFVLSLALVPLVGLKQDLPVLLYAGGLVALHVFVLGIYVYRVRFRELDPDRRSLSARVLALVVVTYMLYAASNFEAETPLGWLTLQMVALSVLHTVVLLLLMVRIEPHAARTADAGGSSAEARR